MATANRIIALTGILIFLAIALGGCLKSEIPETRYYLLSAVIEKPDQAQLTEASKALQIEIAALRLPQYLERPQIVTFSGENRLEFDEFHQWGGNLRKNMIRVLSQNLSKLLATPNIVISPHRPLKVPDFRIEIEVLHFEKTAGGKIRFTTRWNLSRGGKRNLLLTRVTRLVSNASIADNDYDHYVATMSAQLGEFSRIMGEEVLIHAGERPAP